VNEERRTHGMLLAPALVHVYFWIQINYIIKVTENQISRYTMEISGCNDFTRREGRYRTRIDANIPPSST
jgi:hypothetical protein